MNILKQPFPREQNSNRQVRNAIVAALFVTFFLLIFRPFGFGQAPVRNILLFGIGYGVITAVSVGLFILIEYFFPEWYQEEKWTVGKNILQYVFIIFLIGTANFYYTALVAAMPLEFSRFISFLFFTLIVTFLVVSFLTMIRYFNSLNFYKKEAEIVEEEVSNLKASENITITIRSENEKENLSLLIHELFYIESADNYCKVVYTKEGIHKSTLIRSSLKRLEDQFAQPEIFRCHRSYIVQLKNVERVSGNSQGCRLHFKNIQESIPVSRALKDALHSRLKQIGT
jgi:DNA-binding LytR/AlgR family response regulator